MLPLENKYSRKKRGKITRQAGASHSQCSGMAWCGPPDPTCTGTELCRPQGGLVKGLGEGGDPELQGQGLLAVPVQQWQEGKQGP